MILKYTAALLLFCLCVNKSPAQEPGLDSLLKAENEYTKEDTNKVKLLNNIAFYQQYVNPDKGLMYAEMAIALSTKIKDEPGLARANYVMGANYSRSDQISKALEYLQKAARMYESQKKLLDLARVYNTIGASYLPLQEHYNDALLYLNKAIAIYQNQDNKELLPNLMLNKGLL